MARDAELDRLKAAQGAAFQRKQNAYQAQQTAWEKLSSARDEMNRAYEAKQRAYYTQDQAWQYLPVGKKSQWSADRLVKFSARVCLSEYEAGI